MANRELTEVLLNLSSEIGRAMDRPELVRIGSAWMGKRSIQVRIGNLRVILIPNKKKRTEKSPDFLVYTEKIEAED